MWQVTGVTVLMSQMVTPLQPLSGTGDQEEQNQRLLVHKSRSMVYAEPRRWEGWGGALPGSQGEWVGGTEPIFGPRHPDSVAAPVLVNLAKTMPCHKHV